MDQQAPKRGRPRASRKKAASVAPRKYVEPMEMDIGQDGVVEATDDGEEVTLIKPVAENIENPATAEKLAYEAFMAEMVKIKIHETSEKQADPRFDISVNGRSRIFQRGGEYEVERYFVEGLARAKPVTFDNEEYTRPDGVHDVRWPSRTGLRYPFSIVYDPNPRGPDWLQHVLRQP